MADSKAAEAEAEAKAPLLQPSPPPAYDISREPSPAPKGSSKPPVPPSALPRPPFPLDLPCLNEVRDKRIILASASPRRKQIISQLGLPTLEILPCPLPESLPKSLSPFEYALRTAERKALHVYALALNDATKGDPALLIAADTIVISPAGAIFEKPRSEAEHISMLKSLRDAPRGKHSVVTGMAVMAPLESARDPGYKLETAVEESTVVFDREVSDELIAAYVRTREGADKAGGYGIQGLGSVLVERVEGSWDNVVGLPLRRVLRLVEKCLDQDEELEDEVAAGGFVLDDGEE
ncbi:MAG: hypothetical protein MMC23_002550 [Stictis urceolatum]|nr:hypothetical protein [Stictis urceolata]